MAAANGSMVPKGFLAEPFDYHEEIEVEIDTLTNLGVGLGRIDGWVVMVPFSLPGERVRGRVYRNHKNYSEADLLEVLRRSPQRVEPVCPLFGTCGGCQYQHFQYDEQLEWKRRQVKEVLQRIGGIEMEPEPTLPSPVEYGYRSKITPHYGSGWARGDRSIGFLKVGRRREMVDVPQCPIATGAINEALPGLRQRTRERFDADPPRRGGTLLLRDTLEGVTSDWKAEASAEVHGITFRYPAGEFFQNNPFILERFVDVALGEAAAEGVRFLIDAYCGSGLFSLCGSRLFEACEGIEVSERSIEWAERNRRANSIDRCRFRLGDAAAIFSEVAFPASETAVLLDPPRRGSDPGFLNQLLHYGPARVVYVSCDPATQARDLRHLIAGGYVLERIRPVDLFPQTRHIETIATLRPAVA